MGTRLASREARDFVVGFGAVELGYQTLEKLAAVGESLELHRESIRLYGNALSELGG